MIQVQDLPKTFGEVKAVDGISFEVRPGEIFAFLGPNGAGKTTTIQMLTTLLRPSGGRIALDGLDPVASPMEVRKRFGILRLTMPSQIIGNLVCLHSGAVKGWIVKQIARPKQLALSQLKASGNNARRTVKAGRRRRGEAHRQQRPVVRATHPTLNCM